MAETHGGFDNDAATMNAVLFRILGKKPTPSFEARDLDYRCTADAKAVRCQERKYAGARQTHETGRREGVTTCARYGAACRRTSSLHAAKNFRRIAFAMASTPAGFIDVTAIPWNDDMNQSSFVPFSKFQGQECFAHVGSEGRLTTAWMFRRGRTSPGPDPLRRVERGVKSWPATTQLKSVAYVRKEERK